MTVSTHSRIINYMKTRNLFPVFILILILSCSCFVPADSLSILSYNVQNLFDDVRDGGEYYNYNPSSGKWGSEMFQNKLNNLAEVIRETDADIIILLEVENQNCVDSLVRFYLPTRGYRYNYCLDQDHSNISTAVVSRIPVDRLQSHRLEFGRSVLRDISELFFEYRGTEFVIIANHWKSKLGGAEETEQKRRLSAQTVRRLLRDRPVPVIVVGDLNEDLYEFEKQQYRYPTALIPLREAHRVTEADRGSALIFSERKADIRGDILYSIWSELPPEKGSYFYNSEWQKIDHIFVNEAIIDPKRKPNILRCEMPVYDFMINRNGKPRSFSTKTFTGVSDHFPLLIELEF